MGKLVACGRAHAAWLKNMPEEQPPETFFKPSPGLPPRVAANDRVVLFDGQCVMCTAGARLLLRADKHGLFKLGSVQSAEGQAILAWHGLPVLDLDTFILSEGARLYVRSSAYVRIVSQLPLPWKLGALLWIIPRPLRDRLYDAVARNRYRFFPKRQVCAILDAKDRSRLLASD